MPGCSFCDVVSGEAAAYVLHEDDRTLAFLDMNPAARGHTLVVPKDHRAELLAGVEAPVSLDEEDDQPPADASDVFETVETVSRRLDDRLDPDGFSVFYTTETLVGTVTHAHVHLVPRDDGDDISLALDRRPLDETWAAEVARTVQERR
jgi:histidine triad (HIT) family protein